MLKHYFLFLLFLIYSIGASCQSLIEHIPDKASFVFEVNFPEILKSVSLQEFEESKLGKSMLKEFSKPFDRKMESFSELGVDLNQPQYAFMDFIEGGFAFVYLFPLNNTDVLEKFIEQKGHNIVRNPGENSAKISSEAIIRWNNNTVALIGYYNLEMDLLPNYLNIAKNPIINNAQYKKSKQKDAVASLYMGNFDAILDVSSKMSKKKAEDMRTLFGALKDYQSVNMNFTSNEEETMVNFVLNLEKKAARPYTRMSKGIINPAFFEYVNLEDCIAYFSSHMNLENTLEEYPDLIKNQYLSLAGVSNVATEFQLSLEVFKTVIDEKAIGELIKGDMMMALSELKEMEVEYIDYVYDSNWNRTEIVKTKTELVPDFFAMASVKEGEISDLITKLLLKYHAIEEMDGYYKLISFRNNSFDLYYMIKNDILFIGTSETQFQKISKGQKVNSTPSDLRGEISKSQAYVFFAPGKIKPLITNNKQARMLAEAPDFYFIANKPKKNQYKSSLVMKTPTQYQNGLSYLFHFFSNL